jgi:hypothetical protein
VAHFSPGAGGPVFTRRRQQQAVLPKPRSSTPPRPCLPAAVSLTALLAVAIRWRTHPPRRESASSLVARVTGAGSQALQSADLEARRHGAILSTGPSRVHRGADHDLSRGARFGPFRSKWSGERGRSRALAADDPHEHAGCSRRRMHPYGKAGIRGARTRALVTRPGRSSLRLRRHADGSVGRGT